MGGPDYGEGDGLHISGGHFNHLHVILFRVDRFPGVLILLNDSAILLGNGV